MMVVVNHTRSDEAEGLARLYRNFGNALLVIALNTTIFPTWVVESMDKSNVEWSRRILHRFLQSDEELLLKVDPDTIVFGLPELPLYAEIAGDFRFVEDGIAWLGAAQFFSRPAAQKILDDPFYLGSCVFQDVALARSAARQNLRAVNLPEVAGWELEQPQSCSIWHHGIERLPRLQLGLVNWN